MIFERSQITHTLAKDWLGARVKRGRPVEMPRSQRFSKQMIFIDVSIIGQLNGMRYTYIVLQWTKIGNVRSHDSWVGGPACRRTIAMRTPSEKDQRKAFVRLAARGERVLGRLSCADAEQLLRMAPELYSPPKADC